jgi:hypothetical protein
MLSLNLAWICLRSLPNELEETAQTFSAILDVNPFWLINERANKGERWQ